MCRRTTKKYNLSAEYNRFATLEVANTKAGDLDETPLNEAKILKVSFNTKGRGYSGVMKRHNFAGVQQVTVLDFTDAMDLLVIENGQVVFNQV